MTGRVWILALLCLSGLPISARAQEDFLTDGEIIAVRDAQEPDKRLVLYLDFAQRRLDAVKASLDSKKSNAGRSAQKNLGEYVHILEALEGTIQDARERRIPAPKGLLAVETRGAEFLKYLESLDSESSPGWADYQFTLEEALEMTREEIAEAKKGSFPEVQERKPPSGMPASPPPEKREEEGPPRRRRPAQ